MYFGVSICNVNNKEIRGMFGSCFYFKNNENKEIRKTRKILNL